MEKENIKIYLKTLMELESEKFKLDEIKKQIVKFECSTLNVIDKNKFVGYSKFETEQNLELVPLIKATYIREPVKPVLFEIEHEDWMLPLFVLGIIFIIFGLFSADFEIGMFLIIAGAFVAFGSGCGLYGKIQNKREYKKRCIEYEKNIKKYNRDILNAKKKYDSESKKINNKYKNKIIEQENLYKEKCAQRRKILKKIKKLKDNLDDNLEIINYKLNELYDMDIIFPKYRNFIAISSIYEYFASSRVEKLEGVNGAYNLYENDMKNNIIVKLSDINKNYEKIKNSQYCMYVMLNNIYYSISSVNDSLNDIKKQVKNHDLGNMDIIDNCILVCQENINKNINVIENVTSVDFLIK